MIGPERERLIALRDKMLRLGITSTDLAIKVGFPPFDVQKALRGIIKGRLVDLIGAALETLQREILERRAVENPAGPEEVFIRLPIYTADNLPPALRGREVVIPPGP